MRPQNARWIARLVASGILAASFAYVPYRVYGSDGVTQLRALDRQHDELVATNRALEIENGLLRREVARLRDDLSSVAAVARDELGMVGAGEAVIQIDRGVPVRATEGGWAGHTAAQVTNRLAAETVAHATPPRSFVGGEGEGSPVDEGEPAVRPGAAAARPAPAAARRAPAVARPAPAGSQVRQP